ncbi:MAG: ribosome-binding factor A [Bacteroidetes bacterium]|nr:ribosome-binding factor A [Bacteroidota bacterium]MDA0899095.1 ribosome-binding factor A [Bacteroidota bacterium]
MESTRQLKIAKLLQKEMATILQKLAREHFSGTLLSVSKVRVSPDLGVAKIYISIFPVNKTKEVEDFLQLNNPKLRGALGHSVGNQLRVVPELVLRTDDSLEYEENIERLLRGDDESPIK